MKAYDKDISELLVCSCCGIVADKAILLNEAMEFFGKNVGYIICPVCETRFDIGINRVSDEHYEIPDNFSLDK